MDDFRVYLEDQRDLATTAGVTDSRFWELSPRELHERAAVVLRREEREWERAAWMVHHIMSAFVGSKAAPSVDRLLGRVVDA